MVFHTPLRCVISSEVQDFRKLRVWQHAIDLKVAVYRATREYPNSELFGLISQTRRSSNSIGANIAEGTGRDRPADFARFLRYAVGSANEVEHHLLLARRLEYLTVADHQELKHRLRTVRRMLSGLLESLRADIRETGNGKRGAK